MNSAVASGDFPHLLVYGPPGAGKKTRVQCILRELYGAGAERLKIEHKTFQTPSNKRIELSTVASNYHIEINPGDVGIYDRIVVQEIVKSMAQTQQVYDSGSNRDFKVVVLTEVDRLTKEAQHALRRTMEKYTQTCRLILCCNSTSKVIGPLRSRCLAIRVPAPSDQEVVDVLNQVCRKEHVVLPPALATNIAKKSFGNLRRALLMIEACRVQQHPLKDDQQVVEPEWELYIRETAQLIIREQSPENLLKVRERLYELLTRCIPPSIIFEKLLKELLTSCDSMIKAAVVASAAEFEHRLNRGSKHIFHLEAFIASFMAIYKRHLEETLMAL
uniref:Replication factor C subunit 3 n=1 Tax=Plectus sambesii TaxID=2011161 RepID=A0A914UTR6_9BILA